MLVRPGQADIGNNAVCRGLRLMVLIPAIPRNGLRRHHRRRPAGSQRLPPHQSAYRQHGQVQDGAAASSDRLPVQAIRGYSHLHALP